jgi:hypothetical protein
MANLEESRVEGGRPAVAAPFVFYSSLHGRPVVDATGVPIGRLSDLAVAVADVFPAATALLVRRGRLESFSLTARWRDVDAIDGGAIRLKVGVDGLVPGRWAPPEKSFWVGQFSWCYVQPLGRGGNGDALQLRITRKDLQELHPAELSSACASRSMRWCCCSPTSATRWPSSPASRPASASISPRTALGRT